jgi:hypothetical protein
MYEWYSIFLEYFKHVVRPFLRWYNILAEYFKHVNEFILNHFSFT